MLYSDDKIIEKEYSIDQINEQVDYMIEAGLISKISNGAKRLLIKGKAIFSRRKRKVIDNNTGEDIETVEKTEIKQKNT